MCSQDQIRRELKYFRSVRLWGERKRSEIYSVFFEENFDKCKKMELFEEKGPEASLHFRSSSQRITLAHLHKVANTHFMKCHVFFGSFEIMSEAEVLRGAPQPPLNAHGR